MAADTIEAVMRRDKLIVAASLTTLAFVTWGYVLRLVGMMDMGGMAMPGMRMSSDPFEVAMFSSLQPWNMAESIFAFIMWAVMMVGMMTPAAAPTILIYARVRRQANLDNAPLAATGYFAGGYFLAWFAFSLVATMGQWLLERYGLLDIAMRVTGHVVAGVVLIAAGVFQLSPVKDACLRQCQSPFVFIQRHGGFNKGRAGSLKLGFDLGLYCVGCCWSLMALLFVGGIMNIFWIAAIAVFVLAEKLMPKLGILSRLAGAALFAAGIALIICPLF
jgi:predicted metal-binding membrane protein